MSNETDPDDGLDPVERVFAAMIAGAIDSYRDAARNGWFRKMPKHGDPKLRDGFSPLDIELDIKFLKSDRMLRRLTGYNPGPYVRRRLKESVKGLKPLR